MIEGEYREMGKVDPLLFQNLRSAILKTPESEWYKNTYRQDTFDVHKNTQAIVMKFVQNEDDDSLTQTFNPWFKYREILEKIWQSLGLSWSVISRCMFARMPSGSRIHPHIDLAKSFDRTHRMHIPIVTSKDVHFFCGGKEIAMKEGYCYELNNKVMHSVVNNGADPRVHFIWDYK